MAEAGPFTEMVEGSFWAVVCVGLKYTSTDTTTTDAPIDFRSRMRIRYLLLPTPHSSIIIIKDQATVQRIRTRAQRPHLVTLWSDSISRPQRV